MNWHTFMGSALEEAALAPQHGDVPIGAVLVESDGTIVAKAHNRREESGDATAHAEMIVIRDRSIDIGSWRLEGHTLVVTVEPCAMCAMAAVWARIERIVYAVPDFKAGACWSLFNIPQDGRLNHHIDLVTGVREEEAKSVMERFFAERR